MKNSQCPALHGEAAGRHVDGLLTRRPPGASIDDVYSEQQSCQFGPSSFRATPESQN